MGLATRFDGRMRSWRQVVKIRDEKPRRIGGSGTEELRFRLQMKADRDQPSRVLDRARFGPSPRACLHQCRRKPAEFSKRPST